MKKETFYYILTFFAVFIAVTSAITYTGADENLDQFHQLEIQEGDSLWSIADKLHKNANISKQEFVYWMQEKNNIQSQMLKPGDYVFVPIEKEHHQFTQIASE